MSTLLALLVGFGLMQMGNTLQGTLLSVRGEIEGFSPAQIGAVEAGFWVGIVIGSLRGGTMIRRVGHIRTFAALGAIASMAPLLHLHVNRSVRLGSSFQPRCGETRSSPRVT
jgi:predicted MFS family arabinose efflux permease